MCKILGLRKEDIIGHKIYEFVDKKNKAIFENQIALRDRGKESAYEITLLNSKGSKIHCLFNATPLYDKGEKIGSFAMITDITKIKELENKLRKYSKELEKRVDERTKELAIINEQLKKANEIKSNFLANVSHELRTPLTSIRSFSEILLDYKNEDESIREEFLKIINEEAERLTRLINDVLDVSKIEAGKIEWSDDFYYIEEIVTEALNFILPLANKKSIPVKKEISQNLPPVFVDKDRIVQVFLNLLDNAVKFTDKGQVKIGAKLQDRSILCYVSDSGKGIPEAYQSKIFERFEQVNEDVLSGKKARGTGLGLSICKGIIEHYGGEMWLESQIGKGSTFFFTLPVRLRGKKTRPMMPKTPSPDRKKILIIDDDIDFISAVKFYLEKKGYKVYAAYDGEEGIKTCQIVKPDLIILDMLMPKKNGINTLKSLKKDRLIKNTPVIVLTVNAIENGRTKCLALGAKRYITKKENLDALLKEIKEVLENEKKE
jgi:PAS domain S-box-containing protein